MTTPTRDEVVRLAAAAGSEPAYYGIHETVGRKFYCLADLEAFYNLARADLEATIAEQAAELESLRKDAERYRWLNWFVMYNGQFPTYPMIDPRTDMHKLDADIDFYIENQVYSMADERDRMMKVGRFTAAAPKQGK